MDRPRPLPMKSPIPESEQEDDNWQFYAEPLQAWRAWRIMIWDGILVLESITYKVPWIPRQEFVAECISDNSLEHRISRHAPPDLDHGCGIHSLKSKDDAMLWMRLPAKMDTVAFGRVSIWGHCLKYTKGYLSEFAYPSLIYIPVNQEAWGELGINAKELAHDLAETYRVEAVTI